MLEIVIVLEAAFINYWVSLGMLGHVLPHHENLRLWHTIAKYGMVS
jgi:hypothetical protein